MALTMKRGDTRTAIKAALKLPSGKPENLTDATVNFIMARNGRVLINREADILDGANGKVCFIFFTEEVQELGVMKAEFEVTYSDGSIEKFPNSGYIWIEFIADLGGVISAR